MGRVASQGLLNLFVDDDIDLDSALRSAFDNLVKTPFLVEEWRTAQEEFRGEPPILNVNGLFGVLEANRDGIEIIAPVYIPFDFVAVSLGKE